jgi:hypothetical protein
MLPALNSQKIRLQELISQRKPLLELKIIDDQISECNQQIHRDKRKLK